MGSSCLASIPVLRSLSFLLIPTMIPLLLNCLVSVSTTSALPFPQLTAEQFSARARSLDFPPPEKVFIVNGYSNVRRQGRMGSQENIKYPQLVVKDPNELLGGYSKNSLLTNGPVFDKESKEEKESTARIQEQINAVNDDLINKLEAVEQKLKEDLEAFEEVSEIEEVHDVGKLVAALEEVDGVQELIDIKKLTDIAAAEIVAEELAENIESIVDLKVSDEALKKEAEDVARIVIDSEVEQLIQEIVENEVEDVAIAEEMIKEEAEEIEADLVAEAVTEMVEIFIENDKVKSDEEESIPEPESQTESEPESEPERNAKDEKEFKESTEEGSGSNLTRDFGDIKEVSLI